MEAINFNNVHFSYDEEDTTAFSLKDINLSVNEGEFVAVLGHNGSGKSTLAKLIDGLISPSSGDITVLGMSVKNNKNIFNIRKNVGIVFQNPDNQTVASIVEDDIAFGPENIGIPRKEIGKRISFALDAVGMSEFRHSTPERLSGGQKQRIAIAGVLALCPKIMILDESTAMLDPKGRKEVMDVVLKLNKKEHITVLLITHFPEEALLADRAIVMNKGEVVLEGTPNDILCREEELYTYNLALPRSVEICRKLRKGGLNIEDSLSYEKIADEINSEFKRLNVIDENKFEEYIPNKNVDFDEKLAVECKNLQYVYNANSPFSSKALDGVELNINSGEFFGIIGHTGSGKSTFVQHLNALIKLPTAEKKYKPKKLKKGQVPLPKTTLKVAGFDLSDKNTDFKALRSKVGIVFQYPEYQLFAETVYQDVAFGLKNFSDKELTHEFVRNSVKEALEIVGLNYEDIKNRSPFDLSGGQKRRVAIAGVIVTKPEILVLDEPAAGLDTLGKKEIMQLLHKIHRDWGKTIIIVSHDMDEICDNCTRAAVFSEGKIVAVDTPYELFKKSDMLISLGLDIPFTAKITRKLKSYGIVINSNLTMEGFSNAVLKYAGILIDSNKSVINGVDYNFFGEFSNGGDL